MLFCYKKQNARHVTSLRTLNSHGRLGNHHAQLLGTRRCCPQRYTSPVLIPTDSFLDVSLTNTIVGLLLQSKLFPSISLTIHDPYYVWNASNNNYAQAPLHKDVWGSEGTVPRTSTHTLDGGEWPALSSGRFTPVRTGEIGCRQSKPSHSASPVFQ
jgi:hypothetical protein